MWLSLFSVSTYMFQRATSPQGFTEASFLLPALRRERRPSLHWSARRRHADLESTPAQTRPGENRPGEKRKKYTGRLAGTVLTSSSQESLQHIAYVYVFQRRKTRELAKYYFVFIISTLNMQICNISQAL